jgi:hypothetical protein
MLYAVSKKELDSEQKRSLKDLLLKDQAWYEYFQKHKDSLRPEVLETISNILSCGSTLRGFSCYECPNPKCTHSKKVAFTCHNRFCSKCGKKATENWISKQIHLLPSCDWQHITFTMPRELWRFFKENWTLLGRLLPLAASILLQLAGHKGVLPGMFAALHSFGRDLKLNPHVHISTTRGGLNDKETRFVSFYFKKKVIMKMWRYRVIGLLKRAYKEGVLVLPEGLNALCPTFAHFSVWLNRRLNKPWIVHVAKPQKNPQASINYLGRYIRRPPIGHSRLRHYNGQHVTFNFLNHKTNQHEDFHCSAEEFIRRLVQHIPKKHFRMLRYYGFLANRVRGEKLPLVRTLLGQESEPKTYNLKYAELMQKTFGINPKECILCHTEMELAYRKIGANAAFFYENHEKLAQRKRLVA